MLGGHNDAAKLSSYLVRTLVGSGAQVMGNRQERKHRRFRLECPVYVKCQSVSSAIEIKAISKNVSIGGLLVKSATMIPEHTPVTFIMNARGDQVVYPIYLVGEGEIVRVEGSGSAFAIAIKCKVPITQLEDFLAQV